MKHHRLSAAVVAVAVLASVGWSVVGASAASVSAHMTPHTATVGPAPAVASNSATAASVEQFPAGQYIVTLDEPAAATYRGGVTGFSATAATGGRQLDARLPAVAKYSRLLTMRQRALAAAVGVVPLYNYTIAYDGFAARLTSAQATRLAKSTDVASVVADTSFAPAPSTAEAASATPAPAPAATSPNTAGAASDADADAAGAGIVIGDIDTGIAPENPSFAAPALGTESSTTEPWLDDSTVSFAKADGSTFTSEEIPDTTAGEWDSSDYNQKIIAARYFVSGFGAQHIGSPTVGEYLSPRDGAGHGSHTASTAAGADGVEATIDGVSQGAISGIAPAAKLAVYKACWSDSDASTTTGDRCYVSDTLAAVDQAVADGVDVINFSIGGSSDTSFDVMGAAFLNAAAAGVFVATAAGNDGPSSSTVENVAPWETTVAASDQTGAIASFSSRGPSLADGGDLLKPDLAAPGVSILAAIANAKGSAPRFGYLSGTSMATPHVAGFAALYLSHRPRATPAEIKSALMTSATEAGGVLASGAGIAGATSASTAGFYYPSGLADWKAFLVGTGDSTDAGSSIEPAGFFDGVTAIDPSDLNQASIAIGSLTGSQTVTRSVTSTTSDDVTYAASYDVPGVRLVISPAVLHFTGAGQTLTYSVTASRDGASFDSWATGSLEWTSTSTTGDVSVVRSPIALGPASVTARASTSVTGVAGSISLPVTAGFTGSLALAVDGLAVGSVSANPTDPTLQYTGIANSADAVANPYPYSSVIRVQPGTSYAEFDVGPTRNQAGTDLDLAVYYAPDEEALEHGPLTAVGLSATARAHESVGLANPNPGYYVVFVSPYATPVGGVPYRVVSYLINPATDVDAGALSVAPSALPVTAGQATSYALTWAGLAPRTSYLALVDYGQFAEPTVVTLDSSVANWVAPTISSAVIGSAATVSPGDWSRASPTFVYQWTRDGVDISGADAASYTVPTSALGSTLGVTVTVAASGAEPAASASVASVVTATDGTSSLQNLVAPTISGSARSGETLRVDAGSWNVAADELRFAYRWFVDDVPQVGVTGATYDVPDSASGHSVAAEVIATIEGSLATGTATSAAVTVAESAPTAEPSADPVVIPESGALSAAGTGRQIVPTAAPATAAVARRHSRVTVSLAHATITTRARERITVRLYVAGGGPRTGVVVVRYGKRSVAVTLHASDRGHVVVLLPKLAQGKYVVRARFSGSAKVSPATSVARKVAVRR